MIYKKILYNEDNLTEEEKKANFELYYVHKVNIIKLLTDNLKTCSRQGVVRNTLDVVETFLKLK